MAFHRTNKDFMSVLNIKQRHIVGFDSRKKENWQAEIKIEHTIFAF